MKKTILLLTTLVMAWTGQGWGQAPVPMASQPSLAYGENFSDITNWTNNFASGVGANRFLGVAVNATGTIPSGTRITTATTTFVTGSTGGVQRGAGNIQLLTTGATDNTSSAAFDLFLDFTGVSAGALNFDVETVFNSTGNRVGSLRVYWTVDGTNFTELSGTGLPYVATNNVAGSGSVTASLPSQFNGSSNAILRFYYHNGTGGSTGSRPKIAIDDLQVTAIASDIAISSPTQLTSPADVEQNTDNVLLSKFQISSTTGLSLLSQLSVITTGEYSSSDVKVNGFKLWSNTSDAFSGATQIGSSLSSSSGSGETLSFQSLASIIPQDATRYYFITVDIAATADVDAEIGIDSFTQAAFTFAAGNVSPATISAGGLKTIIAATGPVVEASVASLSSFGNVVVDTDSEEVTFTVQGSNLTGNLVVTAPTGFRVSTDTGENFDTSVSLIPSLGTVGTTTVYVIFSPESANGTNSGNIEVTSTGATTVEVSVSGNALATVPTTASTVSFGTVTVNSIVVNFTGGNGARRLVLARSGSAVDASPTDATSYTANASFGSGAEIGTGNFVVYDGDGSTVTVTGLTDGITYHFAVFEYNVGTSNSQNYLTSTTGTGNSITNSIFEKFESGSKGSYTTGSVTLSSGNWTFNDALLGTLANDKKNGNQSARIQNSGFIEMEFDLFGGVGNLTYEYASYGSDGSATVEAFYSVNQGATWVSLGTQSTTASLQTANLEVNVLSPVRFRIGKTGVNRVNIDDVNYTTTSSGLASFRATGNEGWRMVSSPVTNATFATMFDNIWTQGFPGANSPTGDVSVYQLNNNSTFEAIGNLSNTMTPGRGYIVYVFSDDDFDGNPNGFPKTLSVSGTQNAAGLELTSGSGLTSQNQTDATDGWSLVGNPFASPIDWDLMTKSNVMGTVYVYDPAFTASGAPDVENASGGGFRAWNGTTGSLNDGHIAPFQGFYVQRDGSEAQSITFNSGAIISTATPFRGKQAEVQGLSLIVQGQGFSNQAFIQFSENASAGFDSQDAWKMYPYDQRYALLATRLENGSLLDINNLPFPEDTIQLPVHFEATLSGEYTITAANLNVPTGFTAQLRDHQTGAVQTIGADFSYSFSYQRVGKVLTSIAAGAPTVAKATSETRFSLILTPDRVTSNEPGLELPSKLELAQNYPNPFNPGTMIEFSLPVQGEVRLEVYNMLGQRMTVLLNEVRPAGSHSVMFDAKGMSSGVYIYRLQMGTQVMTKKMTLLK